MTEKLKQARKLVDEAVEIIGTDESTYSTYEAQWHDAVGSRSVYAEQASPEAVGKVVLGTRILAQIRAGILGISVQRKRLSKKGKMTFFLKK